MSNPLREPKKGIDTYLRPFREGFLNPRLNKNLGEHWLDIDTSSFDTHIGFVDHTDWYETCDDIPDECTEDNHGQKGYRSTKGHKGT